ncbi:hypothetical protein XENTR_v10007860 [Xenopus tropicalis]|uniref:Mitochondrial transcription termination factor 2 n=1 Tax=Xenopus tropicalis TaxID=8364 RepID=A0A7D9NJK7_XENTR|nr:transcription termination factor 2, mitochondrial [Xenopus tropicalis]KAE8613761.1 hypothetical protein XENTR_v10007860 [Xenopus tropicalis]KAE8613762.1 hypothetical protein XENTR_v10007860 [Xenopus tropicalis]KAE8613763.1 hypothetical protein XENTR_v10007860 [Xenopus tropicalis]
MLKRIVLSLVSLQTSICNLRFLHNQVFFYGKILDTKTRVCPSRYLGTDIEDSRKENMRTVDSLYRLCVNIKKIRQLKAWVLFKDVAFVEETAQILKDMGANEVTVANIFESCPEAFLQTPAEINSQRTLWHTVCPNDEQLVKIIEKFPDSFFCYKAAANQKDNIEYFQELGLSNKIISRLLTSSPQIFCNSVASNKQIITELEQNYLCLGGKQTNFRTWLMKLLSQDPFILSKTSLSVKRNLKFFQSLGFSNEDVLKLLSKLKGVIFDLNREHMEAGILFLKTIFECREEELKHLIMKCPGLLCYSVPTLENRIKCMLNEGISVSQIKDCPNVLELTPQIIQFRIQKIKLSGHDIKNKNLEILQGTKKDFEANYGKLHVKKERPMFNPVSPLHVEE